MAEPDARRNDDGFTLLELMVVVLLVAVLASVIVAVITVIVKNAPSAEVRADNSRSYRGLTTWLPRDAASTPPGEFKKDTIPTSPPALGCAGISGPALVQMSWTFESIGYVAGYRLEDAGDDGQQISRYACSGLVATSPFSNPTVRSVTNRLNSAQAVLIVDDGQEVGVRIEMTTCAEVERRIDCNVPGAMVSVQAGSHNPGPANTLPPTTTSP